MRPATQQNFRRQVSTQRATSRSRHDGMAVAPTAMHGSSIRFAGVQRLRHWRCPAVSWQDTMARGVADESAGSGAAAPAEPATSTSTIGPST